jgi:uncharacterized protein (DUF983 family)
MTTPAKPRPAEEPRKVKCPFCRDGKRWNAYTATVDDCDWCRGEGTVENLDGSLDKAEGEHD